MALGLFSLVSATSAQAAAIPIEALIDQALRKNAEATSLEEWATSGLTPRQLFKTAKASQNLATLAALCARFESIAVDDLALFEAELEDSESTAFLPCRAELLKKLERHWSSERRRIHALRHPEMLPEGLERDCGTAGPIELPSHSHLIDATTGPVLFAGDLKNGEIALTFDDGPHPTRTSCIVEILAQAGVRATFFEVGEDAAARPRVSRNVAAHGNVVGSHSWDHPDLRKLPGAEAKANISHGRAAVLQATGIEIPFFRFPYGARTRALQSYVESSRLATFFWNMDSQDWKLRNPERLLARVLDEVDREQRGIILLHDIHAQTMITLPYFLEELKKRGFATVVFVPQAPPKIQSTP